MSTSLGNLWICQTWVTASLLGGGPWRSRERLRRSKPASCEPGSICPLLIWQVFELPMLPRMLGATGGGGGHEGWHWDVPFLPKLLSVEGLATALGFQSSAPPVSDL